MGEHTPEVRAFVDRFLASLGAAGPRVGDVIVDSFGDSPEMADGLLDLVLSGTKTATCGALWAYEHEGVPVPSAGARSVILDGRGNPRCVIVTASVEIMAYKDVPASFARAEGEHTPLDLPDSEVLEHWREGHWAFFTRTLPETGREPSPEMPLVCERFSVEYAEPGSGPTTHPSTN